jgi:hypothetical protein
MNGRRIDFVLLNLASLRPFTTRCRRILLYHFSQNGKTCRVTESYVYWALTNRSGDSVLILLCLRIAIISQKKDWRAINCDISLFRMVIGHRFSARSRPVPPVSVAALGNFFRGPKDRAHWSLCHHMAKLLLLKEMEAHMFIKIIAFSGNRKRDSLLIIKPGS